MVSKVEFSQEADSCDGGPDQTLTVGVEDAGGGHYFVLSTSRWAFDSVKDLTDVLERVERVLARR